MLYTLVFILIPWIYDSTLVFGVYIENSKRIFYTRNTDLCYTHSTGPLFHHQKIYYDNREISMLRRVYTRYIPQVTYLYIIQYIPRGGHIALEYQDLLAEPVISRAQKRAAWKKKHRCAFATSSLWVYVRLDRGFCNGCCTFGCCSDEQLNTLLFFLSLSLKSWHLIYEDHCVCVCDEPGFHYYTLTSSIVVG